MSNFSHKGGAHENAAKKKETKEESFAHRMETLSGETDGRKKPSKKQKTRTLTVVLIVIAGVLALLLLLLLAYSIWSTAPETDDSGLKTQTTATPDMPTASASPAGATAQPSATPLRRLRRRSLQLSPPDERTTFTRSSSSAATASV